MSSSDGEGLPATTILIGSAAAAVFIATGYVAFTGKKEPTVAQPEVSSSLAPSASVAKKDLVPASPYNISARYRDARARAELWDPKAVLTRITAISRDGALASELIFEFGTPLGRLLGPVEKTRRTVRYTGDEAVEETISSSSAAYAMPDPNCPLETAVLALRSTPGGLSGQFGILYDYSEKHRRPVWSFARAEGEPMAIDADSCVLLVR